MRPSLKNPGLKIERAKEHLDILSTEIVRFRKNNPVRVVDYEDSKNGLYIRQIEAPIIDPKLAIIAGDAVYSLRSALDHVAWQLALLTKAKPYSSTCFPIIDEDTADKLRRFKTATKDIPYEAVEHIKDFQPYNKRQSYKTDFLWMLDKLCNIDKHRVIPAEGTAVDFKVPKNVDLSFGTFNKLPTTLRSGY